MPAPTFTMQAPSAAYNTVIGASGTTYQSDANGLVQNVLAADVASLSNAGFTVIGPGFNGLHVNLLSGRNVDGSVLVAAAASGKFGIGINLGTSERLVSEAANSSTIADNVIFELVLPASFGPGHQPTIIANGNHVIGSGVLSAHTLAMHLYPINDAGVQTADAVTTTAQNTPAAAGDLTFLTNAASLVAGGRVMLEASVRMIETAGSAVTFNLNSLRLI